MTTGARTIGYRIVLAEPHHVAALPSIELAAARLLAGHAPESILQETTEMEEFFEAQQAGRLWVALTDQAPVGFALVCLLGDAAHLEELDVDPDHGRRGLGAELVREVCAWAEREGFSQVTLTTFRHLPWNMPFYVRMGFEEVPPGDLSAELAEELEGEIARGLDAATRVAMRYRIQNLFTTETRRHGG